MRKLFFAYIDTCGEAEGIFDQDGTLLGLWDSNDACWRNEHFSPFMARLGFEVEYAPEWMDEKLEQAAIEKWGLEE